MQRERILTSLGYDPGLLRELSGAQRHALRYAGGAWLGACAVLGLAGAVAAWLVEPVIWMAILGGLGVTLLSVNLLRVLNAGGGVRLEMDVQRSLAACGRYRPSLVPAIVLGVLGAILSQPAQLPLWSGTLEPEVEAHRDDLLARHSTAANALSRGAAPTGDGLEDAGFILLRLELIWQQPKRAARWTAIFCLLVMLPVFWSRFVAIDSLRAYEAERCKRKHASRESLEATNLVVVERLLSRWPTFKGSAP